MRVKINNTWYDSEHQAICIQVDEREQQHIAAMDRNIAREGKYASFPEHDGRNAEQMLEWMKG